MILDNIAKPPAAAPLAIAASIAIHILALAVPIALFQTYDRILPNQAYGTTFVLAVGVTVAIVLEAILRYARAILFAHVGSAFESQMTIGVVDHVLRADGRALRQISMPEFAYAMRAAGEVRDFWSGNAAIALHELPFALIYIALIGYIGGWLALIPLAFTVVALIAALVIVRSTASALRDVEEAQLQRRKFGWGIFLGIVEAKAMAAETLLTRRYRDAVAPVMEATARVENLMALVTENGALFGQLSTIGIVTAGAFMVVAGELTTGGLAACTLLAGRSIGPAMGAFGYLARRGQRLEAEARMRKVLSLPLAPLWAGAATDGTRRFMGGTIVLSGQALHRHGGSVSIPQGTFVHVNAPNSPVGTMTLRTVMRIEDSLGLSVTFDGHPSNAYDPQSLRQGLAKASSRAELIRGTLLDNLTMFSPSYEAGAIQLSERLGLSTFVDSLHDGFMTPVGPGGAPIATPGITGRIGLIRALIRQPMVLCLDQADSSLDLDGIRRLCQVLEELKGRTTIFIVSNTPTLLQLADVRYVVDRRRTAP